MEAQEVLRLTVLFLGTGLAVSNAELLSQWRELAPHRLFSWSILRRRPLYTRRPVLASYCDTVLSFPGILAFLLIRQVATLAIIASFFLPFSALVPVCIATASSLLLMFRHPFGQEGSDQMLVLVSVAVTAALAFPNLSHIRDAALAFIAGQAALSYAAAGIAKLGGQKWRRGTALAQILQTDAYGSPRLGKLLARHPLAAAGLSWLVILFEVGFPLVFVAPDWMVWCILSLALGFHLACGVLMGLNLFIWAYAAAFPAVLHVALR